MARGFRMGVGGGSTSRKTYTGTISSVAPYTAETRYIGIASSTSINGLITCEYPISYDTRFPSAYLNINGTDVALSFSAGASKSCIVNIPCNKGDTIIFKITNNTSNHYLYNVAWTLTL